MVYILRQSHGRISYLKIGHSVNVSKRIKSHQTSSAVPLTLLSLRNGMKKEETDLHSMLIDFRLDGEWFKDCPEVLQALDLIDPKKHPRFKKRHYETKDLELFFYANRYSAFDYETLLESIGYSLEHFPPERLDRASYAFVVDYLPMDEIPDRKFVGEPYEGKKWIIYAGNYYEQLAKFAAERPCFSDL